MLIIYDLNVAFTTSLLSPFCPYVNTYFKRIKNIITMRDKQLLQYIYDC